MTEVYWICFCSSVEWLWLWIAYLRNKETLELIQKEIAKQIDEAQKKIMENCGTDIDPKNRCTYYMMKTFYTNMKRVIDHEVKIANFFVERVHRAPWNICDQYISSIIEVCIIIRMIRMLMDRKSIVWFYRQVFTSAVERSSVRCLEKCTCSCLQR